MIAVMRKRVTDAVERGCGIGTAVQLVLNVPVMEPKQQEC